MVLKRDAVGGVVVVWEAEMMAGWVISTSDTMIELWEARPGNHRLSMRGVGVLDAHK